LSVALSAATVLSAALLPDRADASSLAGAAGARLAQDQPGIVEKVARVCGRVCDEGVCRTRCFDEDHDRDRRRDRDRDRDRDHRDCSRVGPVAVRN
jgi:hypothetical protein